MTRFLVVHPGPDFSVADVQRGFIKALRKSGHPIMTYNTNERLTFYGNAVFQNKEIEPCEHGYGPVRTAMPDPEMIAHMATKGLFENCFTFWPDVIIFISAFYFTAQDFHIIRSRGIKIIMLHTESPYQDEEQMKRGAYANLNLLNDPVNLEKWAALGPVAYLPHSYDPDIHYPASPRNYECDFAFVGTAFKSRCEFFSAMNFDGIDTVLGGNGWDTIAPEHHGLYKYLGHNPGECVDNAETARFYRFTKCGINFYRREGEEAHKGEGWAMGPREVEMAACGLFFLRDPRPESDELFGGILPEYSSPQEAEELLRWWIGHDKQREAAADEARQAIADRTFDNRLKDILELMHTLRIT